MAAKDKPLIPVNVISGPLGVGKTTMINHLLANRPQGERWAVLVNEYGLVGLDAALMEAKTEPGHPPGVEIREVAGGCICCSAGLMFQVSLVLLLQRRPDRLLIEPTGLAALSGVLDTLDRPGIREAVDVRSIICLLNPSTFTEDIRREQVADQVEAADVLLASKSDLATEHTRAQFSEWSKGLFPPKHFVGPVKEGRIAPGLLDLVTGRKSSAPRRGDRHGTDHHDHTHEEQDARSEPAQSPVTCDESHPMVELSHPSSVASTAGWICWAGLEFDAKLISEWLDELASSVGVLRIKAVFHTNEGWWSFNFVEGTEDLRPSGYRRDSRLEIIFDGPPSPIAKGIGAGLRACLRPGSEETASSCSL